ncbi:class I SAM-dependent methyltransferase [Nocardia sp. NPDC127526]|uniref:class I SAM-dependent methyltransferase n=1 Tax=Nocardia sp. NPDC127526 TaxID=3345393 RepID=UPI00362A234A
MTTATGEPHATCDGRPEPLPPQCRRIHRRLLTAARCRFAEDCLAEAVSAGMRQAVLIGTGLDTFAAHNPYPDLRVWQVTRAEFDTVCAALGFDGASPAFVVELGARRECAAALGSLHRAAALAAGSQIVFDYPAEGAGVLAGVLRDTGFEVLEDLGAAALASRYLDLEVDSAHSAEPRVVRARVRHNAGRPPSSL